MEEVDLIIDGSTTVLIMAFLLAIAFSYYVYRKTIPPVATGWRILLASLRAISVILIILMLFEPILSINQKNPAIWERKGFILSELGDNFEALRCYDKVLELEPDNAISWYYKGIILFNQKKYSEAISCYNKALEAGYEKTEVWLSIGEVLTEQGNYSEANKYYERVF